MDEPKPDLAAAHHAKITASRFLNEWLTAHGENRVRDKVPLNADLPSIPTGIRTVPGLAFFRLAIAWRRWVSPS